MNFDQPFLVRGIWFALMIEQPNTQALFKSIQWLNSHLAFKPIGQNDLNKVSLILGTVSENVMFTLIQNFQMVSQISHILQIPHKDIAERTQLYPY